MKSVRKRLLITSIVAVCLLAVASLSKPGRAALNGLFSTGKTETEAAEQAKQDLEQRVRARHGWNASLVNSVITGQITHYDREGQTKGQANFTLYRRYPDRMRVEIERGSTVETIGFDQERSWRTAGKSLSEVEARDIKAWLMFWPERLFSTRDKGASYREAGRQVEDFRPATPWRQSAYLDEPVVLEQIEIEDNAGPSESQRAGNRRSVSYYIDSQSLLIKSARWLEPDDPRRASDETGPKMDSRVDFGNWLQLGGVMWPMEITRWLGGRVEFRIEVNEVRVNQSLADSLFQNTAR